MSTKPASKITMSCTYEDSNPNMVDSDKMDNWRCVLRYQGRSMVVHFSMGYGHNGKEPTVKDVLSSLALDSSCDGMSFEYWCDDYGYESDSRKVERTYKACIKQTKALKRLLGADYVSITTEAMEY